MLQQLEALCMLKFALDLILRSLVVFWEDIKVIQVLIIGKLQGTKDFMLMYKQTDDLEVIGYSDSDFASCVDSRRSTSGYIFMLAGGAVSWRSVKQTLTATSTMKAEFVSCFEATSHGVWLKSFMSGLRVVDSISRPLKLYCDNSVAVFMAKNNKSGSRSKHIDIKYLAVRERVK